MIIKQTNFVYRKALIPLNLEKVFFILVHHIAALFATPEQIHQWHLNNGWDGFGYNEYIRKDGTVYIGRGDNIGAQCANMNSKSYGIAVEGNYDTEYEMPDVQLEALVERIIYNSKRFPNQVEVAPHNRFYATSCPGKYFPFNKVIATLAEDNEVFENDLAMLRSYGIINSPDYWVNNAVNGGNVKGEYARSLIHNMATKIPI